MENFKRPRINDYDGDLTKRWYVQYAFMDPDTKKFVEFRVWISKAHRTPTARYAAAKKTRDGLNSKLDQGWNPLLKERNKDSIAIALEKLIDVKKSTLRKRTHHTYRSIAGIFSEWLKQNKYGSLVPAQLNKYIAQQFFDDCLTKEKIGARTYNNRLTTLRTLFNVLVDRDVIDWNVFNKFKLLQETEATLDAYTISEKILIKDTISETKKELWLAAMFVYYGFVRPQELVRLKLMHIDFENKCLLISGEHSKNKKTSTVLIPDQLFELLTKMEYHTKPRNYYIFSNGKHLTPGQKEIAPNRIFNQWKAHVIDKLGIDKGIYLFKHTGAGELFENHADPRNIQLQLRHSSLDETLEYLKKFSNKPNENLRQYFKVI